MPRRLSPNNKTSESVPLNPQPKKKRRSKSSTGPAEISVLSAEIGPQLRDIASPPARKPRKRVRRAPLVEAAGINSEILVTAGQPTILLKQSSISEGERATIDESALAMSLPSVPISSVPALPHFAELHPIAARSEMPLFSDIDVAAVRAKLAGAASVAVTNASHRARASHAWLLPRLYQLRQIDLRTPTEKLLRVATLVTRTTSYHLRELFHELSVRLLPLVRRLGRINPRVVVACVSFAAFGLLLTRVSPENQAVKPPPVAGVVLAKATVPQMLSAKPHEKSKGMSATAARMIDAPSRISSSCEKQAWPYVTASCLTVAEPVGQENPPETNRADRAVTPDAVATQVMRVIPVATSNAQAMITPVSVEDEKPPRRETARRRHHERRHHARTERRRHMARASGVSQDMAPARPWSSNTPW